ncbi:hypothetical protein [Pseudomonas sp. ICMP 561]|uniref:hypothetical protein n=1 Tax=Pseudomonas sp. ICMP 561 TaxID=1718918 RepID=UPI000C0783D7|nr:hypothetical protein [Pseudomonas sp. ICMP 561]PHN31619.1 hypothetical protein AO242_15210 [Pseudomonas sp. ICMP 561]
MKNQIYILAFLINVLAGCSTLGTDGLNQERTSPVQRFEKLKAGSSSIKVDLSDGPGLARWFNSEYNDSDVSCTQPVTGQARGHYFCSGVLLRAVDNGSFNPWEPSPAALTLKGLSFSWIRHDVGINNLYHPAGFIVLSPEASMYSYVPGIVAVDEAICVYPFDAWTTRTMDRSHGGCDFEGTGLTGLHGSWGSCENKLGYSTVAQWNTHFSSEGQVNYRQCSWGADNPQGWRNMIESRRNFSDEQSWNEVLERVTVQSSPYLRSWVTAFFYDVRKSGGLANARIFQQKMANTGKRVPILRLDFTAAATSRFQYVVSDQVTYP